MKKKITLSKEERKTILEMHQSAILSEQQANLNKQPVLKPLVTFDLISDMKKNYGKATILYGEKKDDKGNVYPQYSLSINNKVITTYGTRGQLTGPKTANDFIRLMNTPPDEYNSVAKLIQDNFNKFKVPASIPLTQIQKQ